eukprot:scaffold51744_cov33-Tisochrysis_lutea.AAC.3
MRSVSLGGAYVMGPARSRFLTRLRSSRAFRGSCKSIESWLMSPLALVITASAHSPQLGGSTSSTAGCFTRGEAVAGLRRAEDIRWALSSARSAGPRASEPSGSESAAGSWRRTSSLAESAGGNVGAIGPSSPSARNQRLHRLNRQGEAPLVPSPTDREERNEKGSASETTSSHTRTLSLCSLF